MFCSVSSPPKGTYPKFRVSTASLLRLPTLIPTCIPSWLRARPKTSSIPRAPRGPSTRQRHRTSSGWCARIADALRRRDNIRPLARLDT